MASRGALAAVAAVPVIGFLNGASAELSREYLQHFRQGLKENGYVEGQKLAIEFRWANGRYDQPPALAADLVSRRVAATSTPTGLPAKAATATIPIVFVTGSDPIEQGLVKSLSRPEGNITGITTLAVELGQKRMEQIREVVPTATLIGVLINPKGPNLQSVSRDLQGAARSIGLPIRVVHPTDPAATSPALRLMPASRSGGSGWSY